MPTWEACAIHVVVSNRVQEILQTPNPKPGGNQGLVL